MEKFEEYIKEMNNISPRKELVEETIQKIKIMEKQKYQKNVNKFNIFNIIKKIIFGVIASLTMTTSCFAAYIAISGNTEILEKIGIQLSRNYEENAEIVNEIVGDEKIELTLESASVDESFLVAQYKIISTIELNENIKLKTNMLEFDSEKEEPVIFDFEENQVITKNEDGSYTLYNIYFIKGIKNSSSDSGYAIEEDEIGEYSGDLIATLFEKVLAYGNVEYKREKVKLKIDIECLKTENNEMITGATENNDWEFEFELNRKKHMGTLITDSEKMEIFKYNDLDISIVRIIEGDFGTSMMITISEDHFKEAKNNDIEYVDIIVKDDNDNILKIIGEYETLSTFELADNIDYKDGRLFDKYMVLDVDEDVEDYKIEVIKRKEKQRDFQNN